MGVHIPHDIVSNHILPRVPAKSVCRYKCVSKEWHSFLRSDMFKNKHNDRHIDDHENNLKLLVLSKTKTSFQFTTIDCEVAPSDNGLTSTRRPLPQFGDTTPHGIHILTSFHGLVCLGIIKDNHVVGYSDLILWNPLTNEYKRLSKSNSHMECNSTSYSKFGLYHSRCEDDYKLLFLDFWDNDVYIYSLKSDSWRKVDVFQHISILYPGRWIRGIYLHENLYFLQEHSNGRLSSIIRFDTKTEVFSKIETPNVDANPDAYNYCACIMVKSDCIHVCVKYNINITCDIGFGRWSTCIKLWKLDKDGKMIEVVNYQLRLHDFIDILGDLIPFRLMKNGNWLMLENCWTSYNHRIYKVDLKKKMHVTNKGKEKEKEKGNIYDNFECENVRMDDDNINIYNIVDEEVRYIETFVSPNRYMK